MGRRFTMARFVGSVGRPDDPGVSYPPGSLDDRFPITGGYMIPVDLTGTNPFVSGGLILMLAGMGLDVSPTRPFVGIL